MSKTQELSKTAENERLKLRAAYWNNIAVGLLLAGLFIPLFAIFQHIKPDDFKGKSLIDFLKIIVPSLEFRSFLGGASGAVVVSVLVHQQALGLLKNLKGLARALY